MRTRRQGRSAQSERSPRESCRRSPNRSTPCHHRDVVAARLTKAGQREPLTRGDVLRRGHEQADAERHDLAECDDPGRDDQDARRAARRSHAAGAARGAAVRGTCRPENSEPTSAIDGDEHEEAGERCGDGERFGASADAGQAPRGSRRRAVPRLRSRPATRTPRPSRRRANANGADESGDDRAAADEAIELGTDDAGHRDPPFAMAR